MAEKEYSPEYIKNIVALLEKNEKEMEKMVLK